MTAIRDARDELELVRYWELPDDEAKRAWAESKRRLGRITGQGP